LAISMRVSAVRSETTWRATLAAGVAAGALLLGMTTAADAAPRGYRIYNGFFAAPAYAPARRSVFVAPARKQKVEPKKEIGFGEMPKGPLQIVVSIGAQRVTLYSNGQRVAHGPVSTGTASHPTPTGVFSVIEKDRHHRSNLYGGAPMPFMQRITWSGVALHEGVLPGYPASHGCIRLARDFAQKLWPTTKLGVRVIVARDDLAPRDFEHEKLFVPRAKPADQIAAAEGLVRMAQADPPDNVATDAPASAVESRSREIVKPIAPAQGASVYLNVDTDEGPVASTSPTPAADQTGTTPTTTPAAEAPAVTDLRKAVEVPQEALSQSPAQLPAAADAPKPAPTADPAKPAVPPRIKSADQPVKRGGQVAVFVSRKEKKVFVRQGFIPLFDMPITIDEPEQPLGTHVFTAMGSTEDGAGMRWNLVTVPSDTSPLPERKAAKALGKRPGKEQVTPVRPVLHLKPPSTAAQALDRVHMPQDAVERIAELLITGSSLVISDEGLGKETGRYTEFIVLTR
jgi:hypothetical protein